ncbi:MAG: lytic murein transglycosylase [Acidimicrobiales bacterium]
MFDIRSPRGRWLRSRGRRAVVLGVVVAVVAAMVATRPGSPDRAAADDAALAADAIASVALLVPDERLDPRIAAIDLSGTGWDRAVARLDAAWFARAENTRRLSSAEQRLTQLDQESAAVRDQLVAVVAEADGLVHRLAEVEDVLRARALDRFVNFGSDPLLAIDDPAEAADEARSAELSQRADEVQFSTRAELLDRQARTDAEQRHLLGRAVELSAEIGSTETVIEERRAAVEALDAEVENATDAVRSARWGATIPGTDLSVVALDAYLNAEKLLAETASGCNLRWWMIAGVARIESRHGRYGGRSLQADGRVDRPIIGIALDGGPGVRAMVDTDDGVYDGDIEWDRAVGPLQFIPETWLRRGRDGNGDGRADPQNLYDAAYSAGRYLCALGGDLSTRASLRAAYFGYNTSTQYVNDVIGHADRYAEFELPEPLPEEPPVAETVENPE